MKAFRKLLAILIFWAAITIALMVIKGSIDFQFWSMISGGLIVFVWAVYWAFEELIQ